MITPTSGMVLKNEDVTWRVVALRGNEVSLSGPGPCRGMRTVTRDDLNDGTWEIVPEKIKKGRGK